MSEGQAGAGAPSQGEGQAAQTTQATEGQTQQESNETKTTAEKVIDKAGEEAEKKETKETLEGKTEEKTSEQTGEEEKGEGEEKPKHKYHDKLTKHFPDREFKSNEDYEKAHEDYVGDLEGYRERGDEMNRQLVDFFEANPKAANVIRDAMKNGIPFNVALARHFGPEDFKVDEDDDSYSDYEKNVKARQEELAKIRAQEAEFNKNTEESKKTIEKFRQDNKISEEDMGNILHQFDDRISELMNGKVTEDGLKMVLRAVQYEQAVADAAKQAEVKGKNEKIKAEMAKEEKPKGDGLPAPDRGGEVKEKKKKPSRIDDIIETSTNLNAWEQARQQNN